MSVAVIGQTYALVLYGRAHQIFTVAQLPAWNDANVLVVDVTGRVPAIGDLYNPATGVFSIPPAPAPFTPPQLRIRNLIANDVTLNTVTDALLRNDLVALANLRSAYLAANLIAPGIRGVPNQ